MNQKAVRYVVPVDMEVTADSFEFQVTDPAGNAMLPEVYVSCSVESLISSIIAHFWLQNKLSLAFSPQDGT